MKIKELKEKSEGELKKILSEKRDKVRALRFEIATKQVKNNQDIKKDKKDIARILTLLKVETK